MKWKKSKFLKFLSFWPPYFGAGVKIKKLSSDFKSIDVEMKLRFWNRNYVGVHFGGSLYSMADPFIMLMLMENLGPKYIVWDKAASIEFKKPGKGRVRIHFRLSDSEIEKIKTLADENYKHEPEFDIEILDDNNEVIAKIHKKLYVRKK